ncbi:MAG: hypothetical protein WC779_07725 [Candidatus Omnitrophota bacterium]|jgi:hypothetical protein
MEWNIKYVEDKKILHVIFSGSLDLKKIIEMSKDAAAVSEKYDAYSILMDLTQITNPLPTLDIYKVPEMIEKAGITRRFKIAVLFSKYPDDFYFYETVSENQGFTVRSFEGKDRDKAVEWLTNETYGK